MNMQYKLPTSHNSTNHDPVESTGQALPLLKRIIVVVPLFFAARKLIVHSGKNNGVVCADVSCNAIHEEGLIAI